MHEHGVVENLVGQLTRELEARNITRVQKVRVRRDSTFSADALRQAFTLIAAGGLLEGAELEVEDFQVEHTCASCGHSQPIDADDLVGHLFFCPKCGVGEEIEEAHGLALLDVTIEEPDED